MLVSICRQLVDLVYPHVCAGCNNEVIQRPSIFCLKCAAQLPYTQMAIKGHNEFEKHFTGRLRIEAGWSLFYFSKGGIIQDAIHAMKYKNLPDLGYYLGKMLGQQLKYRQVFQSCDAVVGVPLHKNKKRLRGYNQSDYIAKGVSAELNIPVLTDVVRRGRKTGTQTRKSRTMRMNNMADVFYINGADQVAGKHILLVDDVLTSGATLDFCGQAILSQPGTSLSLATLAMGSVI